MLLFPGLFVDAFILKWRWYNPGGMILISGAFEMRGYHAYDNVEGILGSTWIWAFQVAEFKVQNITYISSY